VRVTISFDAYPKLVARIGLTEKVIVTGKSGERAPFSPDAVKLTPGPIRKAPDTLTVCPYLVAY